MKLCSKAHIISLGFMLIVPLQAISFSESKKQLAQVYLSLPQAYRVDFYCQAPFGLNKRGKLQIIPSERFTPRTKASKSKPQYIEWEHIMPAHHFGQHLPCWRKGGRKACKKDSRFIQMEADKHNLVPAIGQINRDRNDFRYAQAQQNLVYTQYGACQVYTDFKARRFYPASYSRGKIARAYLYMSATYGINLNESERKLMEAWDKLYPPSEQEKLIDKAITIQEIVDILR